MEGHNELTEGHEKRHDKGHDNWIERRVEGHNELTEGREEGHDKWTE